ncbi:MAG: copper homeostasis protein CutC [Candidatus Cryptobacteroides sp.]
MERFLECCCTSAQEVNFAQKHGASRIELCERLELGGVTPSAGLLDMALSLADIPVNVLIRPRGGDFVYSEDEVRQMLRDIEICADKGAAGVVVGALDSKGEVDMSTMRRLIGKARELGLSVTFHRAFDVCADPLAAFDRVVELGCDRLLTSGHEENAVKGRNLIGELAARKQLIVMAGCGVRPSNVALITADEYHASFSWFRE